VREVAQGSLLSGFENKFVPERPPVSSGTVEHVAKNEEGQEGGL